MKHTHTLHSSRTAAFALAALFSLGSVVQAEQHPRRRPAQPSGGLVYTQATGRHICIVNAQKTASPEDLQKAVDAVIVHLHMPFAIMSVGKKSGADDAISHAKKDDSVGAIVVFDEDQGPEQQWIRKDDAFGVYRVNMAVLKRGAGKTLLADRLRKMVWRSLAWTVGLEAGGGPSSILDRAATLKDLDAISALTPGPLQHNAMVDRLEKREVRMIKVGTYRTACMQGWAPAPTNDVQRAIWEKVHAIPAKPMRIEFDPKRGR